MESPSKSRFTFCASFVGATQETRSIFRFWRSFSGKDKHPVGGKYSRRGGSVTLEYGIILPVLLLFIFGIVDTGRLLWTYATLYRATEAAARCGAVDITACGTTSQIQQDAVAEAWGLTVTSSAFAVSTQTCGIQVSTNYTFTFVTPGFSTVTLTPAACYPR